jgi:hypothetical protein
MFVRPGCSNCPPAFQVPVPGLQRNVGAGDLIQRLTQAMGIKPCAPCEQRREQLNRLLAFQPRPR